MLKDKAKVMKILDNVLQSYGFSTHLQEKVIKITNGGCTGYLFLDYLENHPVFELVCENKFSKVIDGDSEKERFAGANAFSKYSNAACVFCYTPPNVYSFTARMIGPNDVTEKGIEEIARYMVCACLEGYSVLDSQSYYVNPEKRSLLQREIRYNLLSMLPWSNPGSLAEGL